MSSKRSEAGIPLGRRMLRRSVTEVGRESFWVIGPVFVVVRGEFLGVMFLGAGNFERADCTLSSIFCILPLRFRIWSSESERGRASMVPKVLGLALIRGLAGGFIARVSEVARLLEVIDGPREWRGVRMLCIAN